MCVKTVFHPTGPCCGENALCNRWPKIDWNRTTWLVRTPDASALSVDTVYGRRTGLLNFYTWNSDAADVEGWTAHESEAEVGQVMITGGDTIFGPSGYWYRGDEYLSRHNGSCAWQIFNREELLYDNLALIRAELDAIRPGPFATQFWFIPARGILSAEQLAAWRSRTVITPEVGFVFEGVPFFNGGTESLNTVFVAVREVLQALTCDLLPELESRADIVDLVDLQDLSQPPGVLQIVRDFRERDPSTWPNNGYLYKPTAVDLAASFMLRPGFLFGVVSDTRSPLNGQFTCFEGAEYTEDGDNAPYLQSTPWELTSGDDIQAEFDFTNRFERTNDNSTLPEWIELELVRV